MKRTIPIAKRIQINASGAANCSFDSVQGHFFRSSTNAKSRGQLPIGGDAPGEPMVLAMVTIQAVSFWWG